MTGNLSKYICSAMFLAIAATSAEALPTRAFERAELFAACAGRLSALAAHQDGFGEPGAQTTRALVVTFEDLLDATLPGAYADGVPEEEPVKWRNRGWSEMASLLARSHFSFDAQSADEAAAALSARLEDCTSAVLPTGTEHRHVIRTESPTR